MKKELLFFEPVRKDPVWGHEWWIVAAHPSGDCILSGGTYAGWKLSRLWDEHRELFHDVEGDRFPLLIKIIEANQDLSVQVHPDDAYAKEHENGSFGKSECWYVLETKENDSLVLGHHATTQTEAEEMIRTGKWQDFLKEVPVWRDNFIQIDSGTIHAIHGGTKLVEIQQNSDITYRLYDYDRLFQGKKRELHIDKALDVITIPDHSDEKVYPVFPAAGYRTPYYKIEKHRIETEKTLEMKEAFQIICVIKGSGTVDGTPVKACEALIVPYGYGTYQIKGQIEILIASL